MRRRLLVGAIATLAITLLTGCPLRAQDHPVPVSQTTSQVVGTPTATEPRTESVTVYLIRKDRLVAVVRSVEPSGDQLTRALRALARGVDATERDQELRTALPLDTPPPAWRVEPDGLQLELPDTFDGLDSRDQVLAVAQLVYTVTENGGTDRVAFIRRDAPVDVPDASGRLLNRSVTRSDYAQLGG